MNKLQYLTASALFSSACAVSAAPNDIFLQANHLATNQTEKLSVDVSIDAVNKTIDVFNIREKEGAASDNAGDYLGWHILGQYQLQDNIALEAGFWHREIDYTQDTNDLQSWLLAARYTPNFNLQKNDFLDFRLSAWGNFASQLQKTSPTNVNNRTLNQIRVNDPSDIQVQADAIFSRKLDNMNQLNAFVSLGYSKVDIKSLDAQAKHLGCLMNLNIQGNNQVYGTLAEPCTVDGIILKQLNAQFNANEFGLDVQKDLNYDAYFTNIGGSWNWRYQKFESQLGYQYQHLWRNDIDDRVNSFGHSSVKDNHSFSAKLTYDFHPKISVFAEGHYFMRNFIGTIPFLYNGVTASRLDRKYGYASLGLQFRYF